MQQTDNQRTWWQQSRCNGILRYHAKTTGRDLLIILAAYIGVNLFSLLMPLAFGFEMSLNGISGANGWTELVLMVMAVVTAGSRTRFILRFGTPRLSAWLCNVIALFVLMLCFQLASKLISAMVALAVCGLSKANPELYRFASYLDNGASGMALYRQSLIELIKDIPKTALELLAWTSVMYFFGCCLRKHKVITLLIVLGLPALGMLLLIVPAINHGISAYQTGDMGVVMKMLFDLYHVAVTVGEWIYKNFFLVEMASGLVCLPLSYLVMRSTKQP